MTASSLSSPQTPLVDLDIITQPLDTLHRMLESTNKTEFKTLEPEFEDVERVKMAMSLVSLLGCLFIIATYAIIPPLRQHSMLVAWVSLMGVVFHGVVIAEKYAEYGAPCSTAPIIQLALISHELFFFVLAFHFYYTIRYPFHFSRWLLPIYHVAVWLISGTTAIISTETGVGRMSSYGFCWYTFRGSTGESLLWKTFFLPVCSGYCLSIVLYVVATKRIRLSFTGFNNARTTLDTMRSFIVWRFVFWGLVGIPYFLRHEQVVQVNSTADKALRFTGRILLASKGALMAMIWARSTSITNAYRLWKQGNWDNYLKIYEASWVMRREILYFATNGIQKAALLTKDRVDDDVGVQTMSIFTLSNRSGIYPWDAKRPSLSCFELKNATSDQTAIFRDYEPEAFHEIRKISGITKESYIHSFMGRTHERFSEGKSGSFLYYTGDQLFILKTCTPAEHRYLLHILPQYMEHLKANPNSYLCRYVGCHELVMESSSVFFIVLTNILNNPSVNVDEFYDLKGSWVGRHNVLARNGTRRVCKFCGHDFIVGMSKEVCEQNPQLGLGHAEFMVGKDLNWSCRKLGLPQDIALQLGQQLYADTEFLQRINSMDYSLIIGLSRHKPNYASSEGSQGTATLMRLEVSKSKSCNDEASYVQAATPLGGSVGQEVFAQDAVVVNMGIIDILTPWSIRKSMEHWIRVHLQCRDRTGISCINPALYANRFRRNVIDTVVFGEAARCSRKRAPAPKRKEYIPVEFNSTGGLVI